jgi:hypothetical protein
MRTIPTDSCGLFLPSLAGYTYRFTLAFFPAISLPFIGGFNAFDEIAMRISLINNVDDFIPLASNIFDTLN